MHSSSFRTLGCLLWWAASLCGPALSADPAGCAACAFALNAHGNDLATASAPHVADAKGNDHTLGVKRALVLRLDFPDLPGTPGDDTGPWTEKRLLTIVNDYVDGYFRAASGGRAGIALAPEGVSPVLRLPAEAREYVKEGLLFDLQADALEAARVAGLDPDGYDRVILLMNALEAVEGSQVSYRGFAVIGGHYSWFQGDFSPGLVIHELGHNLGLGHASVWRVAAGASHPLDPAGEKVEYGHPYDAMGRHAYDPDHANVFGPASLAYLGWLPADSVLTLQERGRHSLAALEGDPDAPGLRALRIPLDDHRSYWLSRRSSDPQVRGGIMAELVDESAQTSLLLDWSGKGDPRGLVWGPEKAFHDPHLGLEVTPEATDAADPEAPLAVKVRFQPRIGFRSPEVRAVRGADKVTLILERHRTAATGPVTLHWATTEGSALAGRDFLPNRGTLRWESEDFADKEIDISLITDVPSGGENAFSVQLTGLEGAVAFPRQADIRLIDAGVRTPAFESPETNGLIRDLHVQGDGKVVLVGDFSQAGPRLLRGVERLLPDGRSDPKFPFRQGAALGTSIYAAASTADDLILGGAFPRFEGRPAPYLAWLMNDTATTPAPPATDGPVRQIVFDGLEHIYVGGVFSHFNELESNGLHRMTLEGRPDPEWRADLPPGSLVTAVAPLPDGSVLVGGRFPARRDDDHTVASDPPRWRVLRLHSDGLQDREWAVVTGEEGRPQDVEITALVSVENRVYLAGQFAAVNGRSVRGLCALGADGALDAAFTDTLGEGTDGKVWDLEVGAEGTVYLAGAFTQVGSHHRDGLAQIAADGTVTPWDPGGDLAREKPAWGPLKATALSRQADGGLLVALADINERRGWLTKIAGASTEAPGLLEFRAPARPWARGSHRDLEVARRQGAYGEVAVDCLVVGTREGQPDVTLDQGTLRWPHGDTQSRTLPMELPEDLPFDALEIRLLQPRGGAETGSRSALHVDLREPDARARWLQTHFAGREAGPEVLAREDRDGDGLSDLVEYALDRDPWASRGRQGQAALPEVSLVPMEGGADSCLEMVIDLPAAPPEEIRYEVVATEGSGDATVLAVFDHEQGWWNISTDGAVERVSESPEGRQRWRFRDPVPLSTRERRFLQLRVGLGEAP